MNKFRKILRDRKALRAIKKGQREVLERFNSTYQKTREKIEEEKAKLQKQKPEEPQAKEKDQG